MSNLANSTKLGAVSGRAVWDGFEVLLLRSSSLELAVVPELGAKIISLKNLQTGREWMYGAKQRVKLFRNRPGDDFARSPMIGWDECLPTISSCHWRGRVLPDHGEVWSAGWKVDEKAWAQGMVKTSVRLPVSPFEFSRTVGILGDTLIAEYELVNLSAGQQEFLWAMHPLLALHQGDRLVLSPEIRGHLDQRWIDSLEFSAAGALCDKAYAGPLRAGEAEIRNSIDRLIFTWDANHCDTLGIWLTRGGWNGHHHIALEPANGAPDSLAVAAGEWKRCGVVPAFGRKSWSVKIRVLPASTLETSGEAGLEETPPAKTGGRKPLQDALQGGL